MDENLLQRQRAFKAKQAVEELWGSWERQSKESNQLSAWNAIVGAAQGALRQKAPAEYEQWADPSNPQRIFIPLSYLAHRAQRDLQAAGADSAGGYLATEQVREFAYPLVGSGMAQAGATFVLNATRDQQVPALATAPPFQWLANESASLTPDTTMAFKSTGATYNVGGIPIKVSRQLQLQSNIASIINSLLIQIGNDQIDVTATNGTGSNQPLGLLQNSAVPSTSGTSANITALSAMEEGAVGANANDANLTWMASKDVRRILRGRLITGGSTSLWPESTLLGHRTIVTSKMPAASLLVGDFANLTVILFGPGLEVLVDPYSFFKTGEVTFQLRLQMGLVVSYPTAFQKSTTVS